MIVKKFLKGFMAAALAVTMAVTPVSSVKAAEVTVTSGASTYTFSQEPVAAFVVSDFWGWRPFMLYCLPNDTQIHSNSQIGDGYWRARGIVDRGARVKFAVYGGYYSESNDDQCFWRGGVSKDGTIGLFMKMYGFYHSNDPDVDEREYHSKSIESDEIFVVSTDCYFSNVFDINLIPEVFAENGATAVQIPVADALAMDNANIQLDTANTQTADADGTIFDAEYYAQTYPDVANAVGTDRDALYNHYVTFGKAEGRMACAPTTTVQADKTSTEPST